ncbi:MAG: hypothetical protein AAF602_20720 [Myxococcota bacterium]
MNASRTVVLAAAMVACSAGPAPDGQAWTMDYTGFASGSVEGTSGQVSGLESAPSVLLQTSALSVLDGSGATVSLSTVVLNRFTLEFADEGITGCVAEPLVEGRADPVVEILTDSEAWVSGTFEGTMTCNEGELEVMGEFDAEKISVIATGS